jgi:ABC-2 type transport system ATP-binding protein
MMPANDDVALSLRGLSKSYGDLVAVRNLSLDVLRGEILGFLGPNGAGKTTTVNLICGLLKGDAGEVIIHGRSLRTHYRQCKRLLGLCPQELVIWESLTCLEQLEFVGRLYDLRRKEARERSLGLLEVMGLADRQHKLAKTLSGGMKRRLNIALALVHEPEVLILDEPQAGLDPQSRILIREYIRSLTGRITVLLTTHDMDEADRLSDRIAIIDHGELLVLDTSENLKNRIGAGDVLEVEVPGADEGHLSALRDALPAEVRPLASPTGTVRLVGLDMLNTLPRLLELFRQNQVGIADMTIRQRTLEDVFISLTGRGLRE